MISLAALKAKDPTIARRWKKHLASLSSWNVDKEIANYRGDCLLALVPLLIVLR